MKTWLINVFVIIAIIDNYRARGCKQEKAQDLYEGILELIYKQLFWV